MNLAYNLVLVIHVIVAVFLIAVILLQGGRGGLGEALGGAAAQSLFGGAANTVMAKVTAVGASMFMVTCLSLAFLSTARGRSVIDRMPTANSVLPLVPPVGSVAGQAEQATAESAPVPAAPAAPAVPAPETAPVIPAQAAPTP